MKDAAFIPPHNDEVTDLMSDPDQYHFQAKSDCGRKANVTLVVVTDINWYINKGKLPYSFTNFACLPLLKRNKYTPGLKSLISIAAVFVFTSCCNTI